MAKELKFMGQEVVTKKTKEGVEFTLPKKDMKLF